MVHPRLLATSQTNSIISTRGRSTLTAKSRHPLLIAQPQTCSLSSLRILGSLLKYAAHQFSDAVPSRFFFSLSHLPDDPVFLSLPSTPELRRTNVYLLRTPPKPPKPPDHLDHASGDRPRFWLYPPGPSTAFELPSAVSWRGIIHRRPLLYAISPLASTLHCFGVLIHLCLSCRLATPVSISSYRGRPIPLPVCLHSSLGPPSIDTILDFRRWHTVSVFIQGVSLYPRALGIEGDCARVSLLQQRLQSIPPTVPASAHFIGFGAGPWHALDLYICPAGKHRDFLMFLMTTRMRVLVKTFAPRLASESRSLPLHAAVLPLRSGVVGLVMNIASQDHPSVLGVKKRFPRVVGLSSRFLTHLPTLVEASPRGQAVQGPDF